MRDFFKSLNFKLILCLIAMLIGIMLYSVTQSGHSVGGSQFVNTISKPFRYVSSAISDNLGVKIDYFLNSKKYYEKNLELESEVNELRNNMVDYENTKKDLEELRKFIGIKEEHNDYTLSPPCKVIAYTANDPFCSFIIDRGSNDGISIYDPVVTSAGLVGSVVGVSEKYSTVRTILSPDLSIGVTVKGKSDTGILEGDIKYSSEGLSQIIYIEKDSSIKKGDMIVTTGSSGLFPADYLVGKVTETGSAQSGLSNFAVLEPFVDVSKLTSVMVVTSFNGKGEVNEY